MDIIFSIVSAVISGILFGAGFGCVLTASFPDNPLLLPLIERRIKIIVLGILGLVVACVMFCSTDGNLQPSYLAVTVYAICMHWFAFWTGSAATVGKIPQKDKVSEHGN